MAKQKLNVILAGAFLFFLAALFLPAGRLIRYVVYDQSGKILEFAAPLAITILTFLLVQLKGRPPRPWLWIAGALSSGALLAWWALWVKFRTIPATGYWVSISGSLLLLIAGFLALKIKTAT